MNFGLWLEPEMVSVDRIYIVGPDCTAKKAQRSALTGRRQLVLDFRFAEVVAEYLFTRGCTSCLRRQCWPEMGYES
jgi:alpha-galactosidase